MTKSARATPLSAAARDAIARATALPPGHPLADPALPMPTRQTSRQLAMVAAKARRAAGSPSLEAMRTQAVARGLTPHRRRYLCYWVLRFVHGGFSLSRLSRAHLGLYTPEELARLKSGEAEDPLLRRLAFRVPESQHVVAAGPFDPALHCLSLWDPLEIEPQRDVVKKCGDEEDPFYAGMSASLFARVMADEFDDLATERVRELQQRDLADGAAAYETEYDPMDWVIDNWAVPF